MASPGQKQYRVRLSGFRNLAIFLLVVLVTACRQGVGAQKTVDLATNKQSAAETAQNMQPTVNLVPEQMQFIHLTPSDGLSQSVVTDVIQDPLGFIWLGTQDGLNRYDGYRFKIFKNEPRDPNSLGGNWVTSMDLDSNGILWIGSNGGGLNRYDASTGRFIRYQNDAENAQSLSSNAVNSIDIGQGDRIWVGTADGGLNLFDPVSEKFTRFRADANDSNSLSSDTVLSVDEDAQGMVWVGTLNGGLNRLDPEQMVIERYINDPDDPGSLSGQHVQSIDEDSKGQIWVGTIDGGLNKFEAKTGTFTHYRFDANNPDSIANDWVWEVYEDSAGRYWVMTNQGGLNLFDPQKGIFQHIVSEPQRSDSLTNAQVLNVYEDRSGILWFGTFGSGVERYDPYKNKFASIRSVSTEEQGLRGNGVWSIIEDRQSDLWVGTIAGGLNRYKTATGEWLYYVSDPADADSLQTNNIYSIWEDRQGRMWAGTDLGLYRLEPETGKGARLDLGVTTIILKIYEDREGRLWVGSGQGLIQFDQQTDDFQRYQNDPNDPGSLAGSTVSAIEQDAQGNLWVGTFEGGLNRLDAATGQFSHYQSDADNPNSLSTNTIICIHKANDGVLWVGTNMGLNRFDPSTGNVNVYRESEGLPNDYVYGILEDEQGNLWMSTNKGLASFDPRKEQFRSYDPSDGLVNIEFNQGAYFKNKDGKMYFGGLNGLNFFDPGQVKDNPYIPPVVITDFMIRNKPVLIAEDSPLKQTIELTREMVLSYKDDFFEFEFAALHYSSPEEIRYAYLMENLDEEWVFVKDRRFASYTNVPPGEYVFRVRGTNSDGVWNEAGAAIQIVIPPPFWQTTWFRILAILIVAGGGYTGVMLRIRAIEQQRRRLEVLVDERTHELREAMDQLALSKEAAEAANRAKSTFLANMSHEFRTPLNAILGYLQILIRERQLRPDQRENLEIIHRSSEHLLGLINSVLEMSKIEAGRTTLNERAFDLHRMLEGLEEMFALRAQSKGLTLSLEMLPGVPQYIFSDEGKLRQVLMNLLGNAVKFTHQGGVSLKARRCFDQKDEGEVVSLCFAVEDSGPGIATEELGKLFTPFIQTKAGEEAQEGTGLGLPISQQFVHLMGGEIGVSSEVGKGSVFRVNIPVKVAQEASILKLASQRRVIGLEPGQPVYRMLAVDDREVNRKLLLKIFRPLGFEVREAMNGKEALEIWETWQPHLVWMDMRMPVMDGYEATRRIKATTRGQATVIIALTASALEEDRYIILSEGCDDYIRKPFLESDLFEATSRHLGVRFIYEDQGEPKTERMPGSGAAGEITKEDLVKQLKEARPSWVEDLQRAAVIGDIDAITNLLEQIRDQDKLLAEGIADLANKYDHDEILALIQKARAV